jgi:uncharacterized protein YukE
MLKNRLNAAQGVAKRLYDSENAIDEAISRIAELTSYMPQARKDAAVSAYFGQEALAQAAQTLTALVEARQQMLATHDRLADTRDQLGLTPRMGGDMAPKPPIKSPLTAQQDAQPILTVVKDAA